MKPGESALDKMQSMEAEMAQLKSEIKMAPDRVSP